MFTLTQNGPTGGDCTAKYKVTLDKEYTLQEFIDTVVSRKDEWGFISIVKRHCAWYNFPVFEYRWGKLISEANFPEDIMLYKVKVVTASRGWSRMDYVVHLIKEVN